MIKSKFNGTLPYGIGKVWNLVVLSDGAEWRSDLESTEAEPDGMFFTEYDRRGFATDFRVTLKEPCHRYEFDLENANLSGRWEGRFEYADGNTKVEFTEYVTVKKFWMKPFAKGFLKKQQKRYFNDLKAALADSGK